MFCCRLNLEVNLNARTIDKGDLLCDLRQAAHPCLRFCISTVGALVVVVMPSRQFE